MTFKIYRNFSWLSGWPSALLLLLISFCLLLPWVSHAARQSSVRSQFDQVPAQKPKRSQSAPGEILVRFRKEAAAANAANSEMAVSESGHQIPLRIEQLGGPEIVTGLRLARVAPEDTNRAIAALRALPDVLYAEPNFLRYAETAPNDPRYNEQWALKNTGQLGGTIGADIKAE